jgi:hypothetical protein
MRIVSTLRLAIEQQCRQLGKPQAAEAVIRLLERHAAGEIQPARLTDAFQSVYDILSAAEKNK